MYKDVARLLAGIFFLPPAAGLAQTVGGRVPAGIGPEQSVTELHLADLFRFVTVDMMSRYVEHLISQRVSPHEAAAAG